jgi:hypothetical protein
VRGPSRLEHHGRRVALLTAPRFEEMSRDSDRIEPWTDDPEGEAELLASPDRGLSRESVFRSCEFGEIAEDAFPAGQPSCDAHRVMMRGLSTGKLSEPPAECRSKAAEAANCPNDTDIFQSGSISSGVTRFRRTFSVIGPWAAHACTG